MYKGCLSKTENSFFDSRIQYTLIPLLILSSRFCVKKNQQLLPECLCYHKERKSGKIVFWAQDWMQSHKKE